jgi:oligopeptide transport system substrate-binding protein
MKILKFLILSLFIFQLTSCQKKSKEKQTLTINIVEDLESLDPRKARSLNSIAIMKMVYEGLTRISKDGTPSLALAKEVKISENKKTYTFVLKNTTWSNGEKLTALDFANSWKKTLSPSFPYAMSYQLFVIKGAKEAKNEKIPIDQISIKTKGPDTLIVELKNPIPYFLELLSMPIFFPVPKNIDKNSFIGNGPFKIKNWKRQNKITLIKNNKYWDSSSVKLQKISLLMIPEETEYKMFEIGKLDWCGSPFSTLPLDSLKTLSSFKNFYKKPFLCTYFLRVNTKFFEEELESYEKAKKLRKSFFHIINRKEIVKHVLQGSQIEAFSLIPPTMKEKKAYLTKEEAFSLFEKSNWQQKPIELIYKGDNRNYLVAQTIQRNLEDFLKIKINLRSLESKVFFDKLYSGKYQMAMGSWVADFNDPINFLEVFKFKNNGTNNTSWENPKYIDLLNKIDICTIKEKRKNLIDNAEKILMHDMPIIPLYHLNMCFLKNEKIKDEIISPLGHIDFKYAYIEN